MTTFEDLGLAPQLLKALTSEGYTTPTPIQLQAIPSALEGHDIMGIAQTGTGKTAAFALPTIQFLDKKWKAPQRRQPRVLVLAPTRELAGQIAVSFRTYGRLQALSVQTVFGGAPINKQIRAMDRGVDVLVATPGRLIDLIERDAVILGGVEVLIIDEADQMMDMGFIQPLRRIVGLLPKTRQTMFFSATMGKAVAELSTKFLTDPVQVSVTPQATTAERVKQTAFFVSSTDKQALLFEQLKDPSISRVLIFTRTKHGADRVTKRLAAGGVSAEAIHGDKKQSQRERALRAFKAGNVRALVATDIAARGLDIDAVSHVINFELPNVPEQYVHRIGRTARAGAEGMAISFVARDERGYLRDIERLTRQRIFVEALPDTFTPEPAPARDEPSKPAKHNRPRPSGKPNASKRREGYAAPRKIEEAADKPRFKQNDERGGKFARSAPAATDGRDARPGNPRAPRPSAPGGKPRGERGYRPEGETPRFAAEGGAERPRRTDSRKPSTRHGGDNASRSEGRADRNPGKPSRAQRKKAPNAKQATGGGAKKTFYGGKKGPRSAERARTTQ